MKNRYSKKVSLGVAFVLLSASGLAQTSQNSTILSVSNHTGDAPVIQVNGRSYVDIEALARITDGSLQFQGSEITLTLPSADQAEAQTLSGFSKGFLDAGIEEMTVIREWRVVIVNAVQKNYPITEDLVSEYRRNAKSKLALASAAVSSDSDRQAFPLLQNEFNNMLKLSDKYVRMHQHLKFIATDSIENDALNEQILNCAREMAARAAIGVFEDIPSCH